MKADDLRSLERTERMMVRSMCGVSLKDRRRSEDLCNLLGINCVADVVRRGRLRWFGHLERKSVDDWVSACRGLVVEGARGRGRSRKTWEQCVRDDMKLLGLHPESGCLQIQANKIPGFFQDFQEFFKQFSRICFHKMSTQISSFIL